MIFRKTLRHPFERRILEIRSRCKPTPGDWYRWDSFANLTQFDALIPGGLNALVSLTAGEPMADIGTGDGDLAFLFESLGCDVTAFDWPGSNANAMRGVRLIRQELGSALQIREIDIDDQFRLDGERYSLVLALGLLYHLKNPFYFLERLARHARHCVLSTVVLPPDQREPIARLTAESEFHNDPTNFWFFSEAGLERLLSRTGWDLRSHTVSTDRYFCLAESRIAKTRPIIRLLEGWHDMEHRAWRWTAREFAAVIENAAGACRFELWFRKLSDAPLGVEAIVNGAAIGAQQFTGAGDHLYRANISPAPAKTEVRVRLTGDLHHDGRELGVIVKLPPDTILDDESGIRLLPAAVNPVEL